MKALCALVALTLLASVSRPAAPAQDENFPIEVLHYDLELVVDPVSRAIEGAATVQVVARANGVTTLPFSLNANLKITSITEGEATVPFSEGERIAEGRAIALTPDPPLEKKKTRTFTFRYAGRGVDPGEEDPDWMGVLLVRKDEIRMSHQSQWYPIVPRDAKARAKLTAPVDLALHLPAGLESLGPGTWEGKKKTDTGEVHTWSSRFSTRASILAGAFEVQELKSGKRMLRVLSFPDHADGAEKWADEAGRALKFFDKWFGKAKDAHYGLAEMHVRNRAKSYNYEADGFSVFDSVLFDGRDVDPKKIAHEAAHLWWGGQIDAVGRGERFLTESLAEYSALRYLEEVHGEEAAVDAARYLTERYLKEYSDEAPLRIATFTSPRYYPVVYMKGAMALRTLEFWAGTKDFDAGLKLYIKRFRSGKKAPLLEDFVEAMRSKCGKPHVDAWAEEWLGRSGAPRYAADYNIAGELNGPKTVTVTVSQSGAVYTNPVEVDILFENGGVEHVRIEPRGAEANQIVIVHDLVRGIVFDPRARVVSLDRAK